MAETPREPTTHDGDTGDPAVPSPGIDPEGAVDALEEQVVGTENRDEDDDTARAPRAGDDVAPAFDIDLDPADQGSAETGDEQTG